MAKASDVLLAITLVAVLAWSETAAKAAQDATKGVPQDAEQPSEQRSDPSARPGVAKALPLVLEAGVGRDAPFGKAHLALIFDPGDRFAAGVALGLVQGPPGSLLPLGAFGRARLLRHGPLAAGLSLALSRGHDAETRTYQRSPASSFAPDELTWKWEPSYRATGSLTGELAGTQWSVHVEAGVAVLLSEPRCSFHNGVTYYDGSCSSPEIPAAYHFSVEPGRIRPSFSAALGYRFGVVEEGAALSRSPATARGLSALATIGPLVAGLALTSQSSSHDTLAAGLVVTALSLGPSVGHVYADEYVHALAMTTARFAALALGSMLYLSSTVLSSDCSDCRGSPSGQIAGALLLTAVPVLAIYDIADSGRAAERSNARHVLANVALVPTTSGAADHTQHGVALTGRF